jgi:hypothetical protein
MFHSTGFQFCGVTASMKLSKTWFQSRGCALRPCQSRQIKVSYYKVVTNGVKSKETNRRLPLPMSKKINFDYTKALSFYQPD